MKRMARPSNLVSGTSYISQATCGRWSERGREPASHWRRPWVRRHHLHSPFPGQHPYLQASKHLLLQLPTLAASMGEPPPTAMMTSGSKRCREVGVLSVGCRCTVVGVRAGWGSLHAREEVWDAQHSRHYRPRRGVHSTRSILPSDIFTYPDLHQRLVDALQRGIRRDVVEGAVADAAAAGAEGGVGVRFGGWLAHVRGDAAPAMRSALVTFLPQASPIIHRSAHPPTHPRWVLHFTLRLPTHP